MNKHADISLHFYQGDHLHCSVGTTTSRTLVRNQNQPLAEQQHQAGNSSAKTLATDAQGSVLQAQAGMQKETFSYTAFGHSPNEDGLHSLAGFNGEARASQTGCYLLGNGYRAYNPVLRRFNSPDSLSPFGDGGLNAFAYCAGDPVNHTDPSGHMMHGTTVYPGAHKLVPQSIKRIPSPPPRAPIPIKRNLTWKELATNFNWSEKEHITQFVSEQNHYLDERKTQTFKSTLTEYIINQMNNPEARQTNFPKSVRDVSKALRRKLTRKIKSSHPTMDAHSNTHVVNAVRTNQFPDESSQTSALENVRR